MWVDSSVGTFLITARDQAFKTSTVAGHGCLLPTLEKADAIAMLKSQVDSSTINFDHQEAETLAKNMDYSPLGIQLAIGVLNETGCSLADFNQHC